MYKKTSLSLCLSFALCSQLHGMQQQAYILGHTILEEAYINRRIDSIESYIRKGSNIYEQHLQKAMLKDLQAGSLQENIAFNLIYAAHQKKIAPIIAATVLSIKQHISMPEPLALIIATYTTPVFCTDLSPEERIVRLSTPAAMGNLYGSDSDIDFIDEPN